MFAEGAKKRGILYNDSNSKVRIVSMDKINILLVDDNEVIRIFFKDIFWLHGLGNQFHLEIASGVDEALAIVRDPEKKIDVVFLDLVMPLKKDGKEITTSEAGLSVLRTIKSDATMKHIKVIVFSGYTDKKDIEEAKKSGADMYLAKEEHLPQDLIRIFDGLAKKDGSLYQFSK
ncbi:MAG: Two component system sensor histidine kinase/response regulator [Candidatus Wolfebacteria bacterium GW2011_GWE1_48_7]|uniref:Two component system sensor histidine kinase/response regulator n=2 Tax=Candidatus Wolfeibacteriota TaxID=1752735 RepID=A0A0G1U6Z8_9BACT|nr:MAG: Two component system sensor histidine kinase/response regulator [Candidatus Wolfebacteria bacterium GW2011_GWB1_47_1]KKU36931.1 MAG: Two component system sensor histidine kinase/response regulator [Candidatus Wolfebacteria bacterium GW2011_GWC2_46_275]KKU42226.1 MAG: Two component system sensor histidine kinase/response regulator [Candidatus Wolfebacteria bacterium GW2011_GWB2_46_69]KKU53847.1 MAG: Two component system sensor histidine kinase/response regulator [Candidatus Wolfebacteria 